ncbi:hypothetical protein AB0E78_09980 [Streptomyces sp. NPDC032198]|uniref:hypothetical protein n=1 Tax=Streptomyces sp. NPDC032198 TaxID=3155127 RepID=UPI00340258A2
MSLGLGLGSGLVPILASVVLPALAKVSFTPPMRVSSLAPVPAFARRYLPPLSWAPTPSR